MKKSYVLLLLCCLIQNGEAAQTKAIQVTKLLVEKIAKLSPDTSNAHEIEVMIGEPAACLPMNSLPSEVWICQWKGVLSSNRIENTLNVTFESGMVAKVIGVDAKGKYFVGKK